MNIPEFKELIFEYDDRTTLALKSVVERYDVVLAVGNGGSSSIVAHHLCDLAKFMSKRVVPFTDLNALTCYANDFGWDRAYARMLLEQYPVGGRCLVLLVSSSGESKNILACASECEKLNAPVCVLTGFDEQNSLNSWAKRYGNCAFRIHVPSRSYAVVELFHEFVLHSIIES